MKSQENFSYGEWIKENNMKNIAIFGASRSGKSTLAKMLCKKYPKYQIINGDTVRKAFSNILPKNNINAKGGSGMVDDFPNFLAYMFYKNIEMYNGDFHYIIDTCNISPEKAKELFNKENTQIIFLGFPRLTEEEHLEEIKKYETEKDWTYSKTSEFMKQHVRYWVNKSKEFEEECRNLNIWFVDTSFHRERKLKEIMKMLEKL